MQVPIRTGYVIVPWAMCVACSANQGNGTIRQVGATGVVDSGQNEPPEDGSPPVAADAVTGTPAPAGDATVGSDVGAEDADAAIGQTPPLKGGPMESGVGVGVDAAAAVDASPPALKPDGSAGPTDCAGLFCEDFESGKIDPTIWDTETFGGQTVTVQSTTVAHGKYAVQFHANPNLVSYDFIITKNAPTALSGHFFGRAYFYITPKPPSEHMEFFFAGTSGFPNLKYIEVASAGAAWQLTYVDLKVASGQAASSPSTQEKYSGGGTIPLQTWACLEWEVNDSPDQETVYVNGTEDVSFPTITLNGVSSGLVGGFADFGFGYYAWHPATAPIDVYYDDIVLDTKRVGCLP